MTHWESCTIDGKRSWSRLMSDGERGFYYDGEVFGTADTMQRIQIEILPGANHLITAAHIVRTWNRLKRRYPLLAVRIEEVGDRETRFVVEEERLSSVIEGEVSFRSLPEHEIPKVVLEYHNGPRKLSRNLMGNLEFILHQNSSGSEPNSTCASVLFNTCHCMTDGAANHSAMKTLLDYLVSPPNDNNFEECGVRLAMVPQAHTLYPKPAWSLAKQRWKLAMAWACMEYRSRRMTVSFISLEGQQCWHSVLPNREVIGYRRSSRQHHRKQLWCIPNNFGRPLSESPGCGSLRTAAAME
jgi:hypothetical protein